MVSDCCNRLVAILVQIRHIVQYCSGATLYVWFEYEIQIIESQFAYGISSLHNTDVTVHFSTFDPLVINHDLRILQTTSNYQ